MEKLLGVSRAIDALNRGVGRATYWLVLAAVLISSGNAVARKTLSMSSNAMLEIQWYLFAAVFMLCAGYTLLSKDHVRVDLIHARLSRRHQLMVEIFGTLVFMLPVTTLILVLSWAPFVDAFTSGEVSPNAGGLIRWPVKLLIPIGFGLLLLQGVSEIIKDAAELRALRRTQDTPR
ncbi:TRAP-type mannitol/chloroaromatic compound transport system, small permease component [Variovorax sp. PBS-H4]|uniref:TRAP transporter small permease subunit n=1 Tax=Variovorax sp. PBS-H4 TaxID=434008 RepID=UPI00131682EE|nr:TRAP transporter small permease subunit [Variovorax sp. PBS-H4]VTU40433.1 TRAP-type mannitol/chloroaromatic compound transport system, small permease component [Variovorax sp. PBS-H4]